MTPRPSRLTASVLALSLAAALLPFPAGAAPRPAAPRADSVVVQFADGTISSADIDVLSGAGAETSTLVGHERGRALARVRRGDSAEDVARRLGRSRGVRWAIPNLPLHALSLPVPPNDPYYANPIGGNAAQRSYLGDAGSYPYSIDLEPAWRQAFAAPDRGIDLLRPGATLALVDTGYTPTAETPDGVFVPVYNYVAGNTDTSDDAGHGTMVGNVMAAKTNNGAGIAGVQYAAPSRVLVYKALDANGTGSTDNVISAVRSAADHGAKVINLSLGGSAYDASGNPDTALQQAWDDTVAYAASKGAVVVAASGNENAAVDFPAAAKGALAVGAIDPATGVRSAFSNFGPQLALVAPGEHVLLYGSGGSMQVGSGTSFASPMVAASIGLLRTLLPKANPSVITSAVLTACRDLGPAGLDPSYGNGELDVWAAYRRLMERFPTQPPLAVSVAATSGFSATLAWRALPGSDVVYHYGLLGGPIYSTTATSAQLRVGGDGVYDAVVSASASDMFSNAPASVGFTIATGHPGLTMQRLAGPDRYATAAAVSRSSYPTGAPTVVVASGEDFPDALSAGVLAAAYRGPLLLSRRYSLPQATADEIGRLHPSRVVVIGGVPALSSAVQSSLTRLVPGTVRISGADRYETAEKVAIAVRAASGGSIASATVVVASGEDFPDALAASPMAAAAGHPILLTRSASLPAATARALGEAGARRALVIGGPPAVSPAVAAALPAPVRIAGADRYATSRAVADYAVAAGILDRGELGVATGRTFPDALAGGVAMARLRGPIVLGDAPTASFDAWLARIGDACSKVDVFGGDAAVSSPFATHVLTALRGL
ncbi:MAG TPA: cell wall-binding repeat-containing protein [Coriobacteriia bacterium]|jgi:putative cell wall-binding protein